MKKPTPYTLKTPKAELLKALVRAAKTEKTLRSVIVGLNERIAIAEAALAGDRVLDAEEAEAALADVFGVVRVTQQDQIDAHAQPQRMPWEIALPNGFEGGK